MTASDLRAASRAVLALIDEALNTEPGSPSPSGRCRWCGTPVRQREGVGLVHETGFRDRGGCTSPCIN